MRIVGRPALPPCGGGWSFPFAAQIPLGFLQPSEVRFECVRVVYHGAVRQCDELLHTQVDADAPAFRRRWNRQVGAFDGQAGLPASTTLGYAHAQHLRAVHSLGHVLHAVHAAYLREPQRMRVTVNETKRARRVRESGNRLVLGFEAWEAHPATFPPPLAGLGEVPQRVSQ